jgi:hypothetical protein
MIETEPANQPRRPTPLVRKNVSVIVPARNEANRIGGGVRAVLGQTTRGMSTEVVVVDNGSTDGTSVVGYEAGARVLLLAASPGNSGAARNAGAIEAKPEQGLSARCNHYCGFYCTHARACGPVPNHPPRRGYRWAHSALRSKQGSRVARFSLLYHTTLLLKLAAPFVVLVHTCYSIACWARAGVLEPRAMVPAVLVARTAYAAGFAIGGIRWMQAPLQECRPLGGRWR